MEYEHVSERTRRRIIRQCSRTRRLIDLETYRRLHLGAAVFAYGRLVKGKTIGIDATKLEAKAALP
jgi:hypothetical protein